MQQIVLRGLTSPFTSASYSLVNSEDHEPKLRELHTGTAQTHPVAQPPPLFVYRDYKAVTNEEGVQIFHHIVFGG